MSVFVLRNMGAKYNFCGLNILVVSAKSMFFEDIERFVLDCFVL